VSQREFVENVGVPTGEVSDDEWIIDDVLDDLTGIVFSLVIGISRVNMTASLIHISCPAA
jgi:predicted acetyltransferase